MEINYIKIRTSWGFLYGGTQNLFGKQVSRSGCGMIAACDYILYAMGKRSVSFAEYAAFINKFRDEEAYRGSSNPIGIFPHKLVRLMNAHLKDRPVKFTGRHRLTEESLKRLIACSIEKDMPLIVRVGLNGKKFPYKMEAADKNGRLRCGVTEWHYITVTGITEQGELIISTWGQKARTDCRSLYKYFGLTGGIIADRKIIEEYRQ